MSTGIVASPERIRIICEFYGVEPARDVLARVNATPGPEVTLQWLYNQASKRNKASRPPVEEEEVEPPLPSERDPIIAGYWRVASWAFEQGVEFSDWSDLPQVNDRAFAVGHPGFARELPVHRATRLRRAA